MLQKYTYNTYSKCSGSSSNHWTRPSRPLKRKTWVVAAKKQKVEDEPELSPSSDPKLKAKLLENFQKSINKKFGEGSIVQLGKGPAKQVERFSSGSLALDVALGGGFPKGRIIEIYGPESSGKTAMACAAVAEVQKNGGRAVFIDAENAFSMELARGIGVNTDELWLMNNSIAEEVMETAEAALRSGAFDLVVVDSVAAMCPRVEMEGEMGQATVGLQARLMSQCLRKISPAAASSLGASIIFINQLRNKVGTFYGNPETTSGGKALMYYASIRMDVRKKEMLTDEAGNTVGIKIKATIKKNKVAPPHREATFDLYYKTGIDKVGSLLDVADKVEAVSRKGAWYYFGDLQIGQGREKTIAELKVNEQLYKKIEEETKRRMAEDPKISVAASSQEEFDEYEEDEEGEVPK